MSHVVLLGDSTFDNDAYVPPGRGVETLLRQALPEDWKVTLLAQDGAVIADVASQLARLPDGATHLLVSVGGNDGLVETAILEQPVRTVAEALGTLAALRRRFEEQYRRMLDAVVRHDLRTAVCTIYAPHFEEPALRLAAEAALPLLNDVITREAFIRNLAVVDLRVLFDNAGDFAHTIEPSAQGGAKLARAMAGMLITPSGSSERSQIFVR